MISSKTLLAVALAGAAFGAGAVAIRSTGSLPTERLSSPLLAGAQIDPETLMLLENACQNCHSERTQRPWYGRLPPASWLIHRDIVQAREHLNFTRWEGYSTPERQALLSAIGSVVRTGVMPPGRYTLMHPGSVLSANQRNRIYQWTRSERSRLRNSEAAMPPPGDGGPGR